MLRLHSNTRESWIIEAMADLPAVLLDHAHCEKKAASMALNMIFRYPEHLFLMKPMSALAREELRHFEQVMAVMAERNMPFERQKPSTYAGRLVRIVRKDEPERLLDMMICAALIEARSCERMTLLSKALVDVDEPLARFYKGLLACEARHHQTYLDLLGNLHGADEIKSRLAVIAAHEAEVLKEPDDFARMHS